MGDPAFRLLELDERHTELLDRLSELDHQIVIVLDDWMRTKNLGQAEAKNNDESNRPSVA